MGDGFDHARSGDEHVGRFLDHEDEVGYGGAVDRTTGARSHDAGDLGHNPAGPDIAVENLAVGGQGVHPFLDAGTARVVQADDGRAHLDRQVHDLAYFLRMSLTQRAADHRKILAEHKHFTAVDASVACHHAVAGVRSFIARGASAAGFEHVELFEGLVIQEQIDPLPCR